MSEQVTRPLTKRDLEELLGIAVWVLSLEISDAKEDIMASLDDVVAADAELKSEIDAVVALVSTLNDTVAALQAEVASQALDQTKLDQLASDLGAQVAEVAAALPPAVTPIP